MKKLIKLFKVLFLVFIAAIVVKAFLLDAFQIPSSSMENTLMPGDFIIVNKIAYDFSSPREIPIINFPIPNTKLFPIGKPVINNLVVFEFPKDFYRDSLMNNSKFIKRIVACPNDTLQIINKEFFVNTKKIKFPSTLKITEENLRGAWVKEEGIYPPGCKWNKDNYGPIIIPAKGDTIKITPKNFEWWQSVIVMDYGERSLILEGSVITLNGKPIQEYILTQDHYFVVGDNLDKSMDSRYFGFITDKMIVGEAILIYWSVNKDKVAPGPLGFLSAIRADRLFKAVE
ncbi:MAG: signal peptidase I [Ignavibacteria bacterium]|nr:signal peptidase I [Ignavibacteria bacterium]MBT8380912.1 signal peptidase I [Ignavibacteria bacterium]MBT8391494.1 signal peptidase I [Ignavibacteria bacterium]NNJ54157.1 signal peptidase I [Ignavibacteriaceae bacterium]NNL20664.1 signal peptidase I [Ignavibacteriaceae bacterium]